MYPTTLKDDQLNELISICIRAEPVSGMAFLKVCEDLKNIKSVARDLIPKIKEQEELKDIVKQLSVFIGNDK